MVDSKQITIEPLARVEGHGGISVEIKNNKISNLKVDILEGPRLFEALVVGKTPEEDLNIVPRICAICNLSHKFAALRGLEKALAIKIPETTGIYRQIMHHGEMIESHSLHIYFLALPDFLGYPNAVAMAEKHGDAVVKALKVKKFGNKIMRIMGGRNIHGENPVLGGFGRYPDKETLLDIRKEAIELLPFAMDTINILGGLEVPDHVERDTQFVCLKPPHKDYDYYGDALITSDGKEFPVDDYKKVATERVVPHSFAKRSLYNGKPFTVGSLARVLLLHDRLEGHAKDAFKQLYNPRWHRNPIYNNFAQAVEQVYSLENIVQVIDQALKRDIPPIAKSTRQTGSGTGGVEAPRGTLIHHYDVKDGKVVGADIITPTAMFLDDVEAFLRKSGETLLAQNKRDGLELQLEIVARAYDPCISCSAHLVQVNFK